jgi:maleylacetoacetate isomerase
LAAKGIQYELSTVDLTKGEHEVHAHMARNPLGQVPVLEFVDSFAEEGEESVCLSQSLAIGDFLDCAYPRRHSMIPKDPLDRARALEVVEIINAGTQPLQNLFYLERLQQQSEGKIVVEDEAKKANEKGLVALEALVARYHCVSNGPGEICRGGPYCLGSFAPTIADAFLVPQMYNARRFGVPVEDTCPSLARVERVCLVHPWFQSTHPSTQKGAEHVSGELIRNDAEEVRASS